GRRLADENVPAGNAFPEGGLAPGSPGEVVRRLAVQCRVEALVLGLLGHADGRHEVDDLEHQVGDDERVGGRDGDARALDAELVGAALDQAAYVVDGVGGE